MAEQLTTYKDADFDTAGPDTLRGLLMADPAESQIIQEQIAAGLEKYEGEGGAAAFLNNFALNFPGGRRVNQERYNHLDNPRQDPNNHDPWQYSMHSALFRRRTNREFYEDIDIATLAAALDPKSRFDRSTFDAMNKQRFVKRDASAAFVTAYSNYILPVYVKARLMGYTHQDLCQ